MPKESLMTRVVLSIGVLLSSAALACAAPAPEKVTSSAITIARKLAGPIKFEGWAKDERMTLRDALKDLTETCGLRFNVNEGAFKVEVPPVPEVLNTPVADRQGLPAMNNVPLETVLRRLLERVPSTSGTTFTIRRDEIEITTVLAQRVEIWGESYSGPFLPLMHAVFDKRPLEEAL